MLHAMRAASPKSREFQRSRASLQQDNSMSLLTIVA